MLGGWISVLLIGGLIFLMFRGGGCCGGHGQGKGKGHGSASDDHGGHSSNGTDHGSCHSGDTREKGV